MEARINSLNERMNRMDKILENIETKLDSISQTGVRTEEGVGRINGNIADLKIKDKQHDEEIKGLNNFKSWVSGIGCMIVLAMGYVVQIITSK